MYLSQLPVCLDIRLASGCYSRMLYVEVLLERCKAAEVRPGELDRIQITTAPCCRVATIRGSGLRADTRRVPHTHSWQDLIMRLKLRCLDEHPLHA